MFTKMYATVDAFISAYKKDERGVTAIEYGLIGVAMAVVLGAAFGTKADGSIIGELTDSFTSIGGKIKNANAL